MIPILAVQCNKKVTYKIINFHYDKKQLLCSINSIKDNSRG